MKPSDAVGYPVREIKPEVVWRKRLNCSRRQFSEGFKLYLEKRRPIKLPIVSLVLQRRDSWSYHPLLSG